MSPAKRRATPAEVLRAAARPVGRVAMDRPFTQAVREAAIRSRAVAQGRTARKTDGVG